MLVRSGPQVTASHFQQPESGIANTSIFTRWRQRFADFRGRGVYAGYPNRYRCIFIHIPKTAGSSIAQALFGQNSRHIPYFEYQQANPEKFRRFFKFAFVRNPWDRLVSTYFFLQAGGRNEQDRTWSQKNLTQHRDFGSFVRGWLNDDNIRSWVHFYPQAHFLLNEAGTLMADYVGRYENLDDDFRSVARRLGVNVGLPVSNQSDHRHYASYYDNETREIVGRIYARDIKAFEYAFDAETNGPNAVG